MIYLSVGDHEGSEDFLSQLRLKVTLEIPVELDNEYQNAIGYLDWQFKVEELSVEPDDLKLPRAGETANIHFYIVLASVSIVILIFLMIFKLTFIICRKEAQ